MLIAVANQKGGCGKTTVAMHLAALLSEEGASVAIADADPQPSASEWAASADDDNPWPTPVIGISSAGRSAHRQLRLQQKNHESVIVDCPPSADAETTQSIFMVADLIVVPVVPSGNDIRAITSIIGLAERARAMRESAGEEGDVLPLRILVNQYMRARVLSRESVDVLADSAPVFKATIGQREAYRQASAVGTTAWALGAHDARREFMKLIKEIF